MDEPVDKLSEVLSNLQDLHADEGVTQESRESIARQVRLLREVQLQMQTQLRLHDAQIAALREVIALLSAREQ